jgi:hypothetical protein
VKYYARGFRVLALYVEPVSVLTATVVGGQGAKYWIGQDPASKTLQHFVGGGSVSLPHGYLVDGKGMVVGDRFPSGRQIEELLDAVFDPTLKRDLHPDLGEAKSLYERGEVGAAWKAVGKIMSREQEDADLLEDARYLRERSAAWEAHLIDTVRNEIGARQHASAYGRLIELELRFVGMESSTWVKKTLRTLGRDETIKTQAKAWRAYKEALRREVKARGKAYDLKRARQWYDKIISDHPGSTAADLARKAVERLPES